MLSVFRFSLRCLIFVLSLIYINGSQETQNKRVVPILAQSITTLVTKICIKRVRLHSLGFFSFFNFIFPSVRDIDLQCLLTENNLLWLPSFIEFQCFFIKVFPNNAMISGNKLKMSCVVYFWNKEDLSVLKLFLGFLFSEYLNVI